MTFRSLFFRNPLSAVVALVVLGLMIHKDRIKDIVIGVVWSIILVVVATGLVLAMMKFI